MLRTSPHYLLYRGNATDFSGRAYENITPFQAALIAGDVKMIKMMRPFFDHMPNGHEEMRNQLIEVYRRSFQDYFEKQRLQDSIEKQSPAYLKRMEEFRQLQELRRFEGLPLDELPTAASTSAQKCCEQYQAVMESNDINRILTAHAQAQKDNCFDGFDDVIAAIKNASDIDIQAVLDDPTIDSPLSNAFKQFKTAFTQHTHSEKIVNRAHLLKILDLYGDLYKHLQDNDEDVGADSKKREIFWRHLVGWVERDLAACDLEMLANPGLYNAVHYSYPSSTSWDFNFRSGGDSILPLSPDSGVGYQYACGGVANEARGAVWPYASGNTFFESYVKKTDYETKMLILAAKPKQFSWRVGP